MRFILDSNIFIGANRNFPPDIWVTFWLRFEQIANSGEVATVAAVRDEIRRGKDELTQWLSKKMRKEFIIELDNDILEKYRLLAEWTFDKKQYTETAKETFLGVADSYLVATAAAKDLILVTHEVSSPNSKKRILIPDACETLNVRYCTMNEMFRQLKVTI